MNTRFVQLMKSVCLRLDRWRKFPADCIKKNLLLKEKVVDELTENELDLIIK